MERFFIFISFIGAAFGPLSAADIRVTWNDRSRIEKGYFLERQIAGVNGEFVSITKPDDDSKDTGLPANTSFYLDEVEMVSSEIRYRVRAWNDYGYSDFDGPESIVLSQSVHNNQAFELKVFADTPGDQDEDIMIDVSQDYHQDPEGQRNPAKPKLDAIFPPEKTAGASEVSLLIRPKPDAMTWDSDTEEQVPIKLKISRKQGTILGEPLFFDLVIYDSPKIELVDINRELWYENGIVEISIRLNDRDTKLEQLVLSPDSDWQEMDVADSNEAIRTLRWKGAPADRFDQNVSIRYLDDTGGSGSLPIHLVLLEEIQTVANLPVICNLGFQFDGDNGQEGILKTSSNAGLLPPGQIRITGNGIEFDPVSGKTGLAEVYVRRGRMGFLDTVVVARLRVLEEIYYFGEIQGVDSSPFALWIGRGGQARFAGMDPDTRHVFDVEGFLITSEGRFGYNNRWRGFLEGGLQGERVDGQIVGTNLTFSGLRQHWNGVTNAYAGLYSEGSFVNDGFGIDMIVGPDGWAMVLLETDVGSVSQLVSIGDFGDVNLEIPYSLRLSVYLEVESRMIWGQAEYAGKTQLILSDSGDDLGRPLVNLSTRGLVKTGLGRMISGFVLSRGGSGKNTVLIRAAGPALGVLGISGFLTDPFIEVKSGSQTIGTNDDWGDILDQKALAAASKAVGAFDFESGSADSACLVDLPDGSYSVLVTGVGGTTGISILEIYDVSQGIHEPRIANISTRVFVGAGQEKAVPGFVIEGERPKALLVRALGPTLGSILNRPDIVLKDPSLILVDGDNNEVIMNDNWGGFPNLDTLLEASAEVGALPLNDGSKDAAAVVILDPGAYSIRVSGADGGTGLALVEIYELR